MSDLKSNRLVKTFAELRAAKKHALLPFITAGYPDCETTEALLHEFQRRGVRTCELGIAYSDPIADGPVIQATYSDVLARGFDSDKAFEIVRRYRAAGGTMALSAMVSYSIVYRHGVKQYLQQAADAGFDATIIPDLSIEEAGGVESLAAEAGLANVMLVAPNTPPDRRVRIASHARGFLYFMSVAGITGERDRLPDATIQAVAELRKHTDVPICVGFGVSNAATVRAVCEVADGAIVGSAIVRRITEHRDLPRGQLVAEVGEFVGELLAPVL